MSAADDFMTPAEVAKTLGVSPITVRSWANKGWLKSQITPGGHRRFLRADVERLATRQGGPVVENPERRVLVVDDDRQFRGYLIEALAAIDPTLRVGEAADGFLAGLALAEWRPDLVLLDYSMPGMNGADVCRMIRSKPEYAATRVVAVTGLDDPEVARAMKAAGAVDVLFKPVGLQRLRELLAKLDIGPGARAHSGTTSDRKEDSPLPT